MVMFSHGAAIPERKPPFKELKIVPSENSGGYPFDMGVMLDGVLLKGVKKCVITLEANSWSVVDLEFVAGFADSSFPIVVSSCVEVQ